MKKSEANIEDLRNQTVSWGTHRPDDLIPKFLAVLKEYGKEAYDKYVSENPEVEDWKKLDDETKGWVVDELFDLLDGIAPEDCYFGALPGDGADFGFWQVDESKKNEASPNVATIEGLKSLLGRGIAVADNELRCKGVWKLNSKNPKQHQWTFVGDNGSISIKTDDDSKVIRIWGDLNKKSFDLGVSENKEDSKKSEAAEGSDYFVIVFTSNEDAAKGAEYARNLGEDPQLPPGGKAVYVYGNDRDALKAFGKKWFDLCVDDDLGTTSTFGLNAKDESKKSEKGNKDIFTLDLTRIDAEGDEEGLDDMQAAQNFYDEDEAIQAAKDLADSYKDDDDVVQVTVMAGEQEKPNGDIVGEPFDIFTASSSDSATTAKYRKKANYTKTDGLDYYAKGGKSEAKKSMGRDQFIKDVLELADAEKQKYYRDELVSFARGCYDHGETSVDKVLSDYFADTNESKKSERVAFGAKTMDVPIGTFHSYDLAQEVANRLQSDLDYIETDVRSQGQRTDEFVTVVTFEPKYFRDFKSYYTENYDSYGYMMTSVKDLLTHPTQLDIYAYGKESKKSEGNDDDKGCKGKDCKDDKTKKNEADAPFKVGDFVTYDAASDGKEDFINQYVSAEIAKINDDGSLVLWIYDLDDGGNDVKDADPQFCTKLDHFAGKVDAGHYYMDGPYKAYKGGWEILITKKDLNPRVYEFIGTMDDLGEVLDVDAYYGGENFVYDQELEGAVEQQGWAADEMDYADMSGDLAKAVRDSDESKKSEATYDGDWQGATVYADSDARMNVDLPDNLLNDLEADGDVDQEDYAYAVDKFIDSCYNSKSYVSVGGKSYPLGVCRDPKLLIVQDNGYQFKGSDKAVELVKKLVGGKLTGHTSSEQPSGDFVAIKEDVGGREHYILYYEDNGASESKKSEDFRNYTLKQLRFQLKNGWAKDLTNASDEEIQAIIDSGHSIGGVSNGTYGMNGLLVNYTNPDGSLGSGVVIGRTPNLFALLSPQKPKKTGDAPKPSESKKSEGLPPKKLGNRLYRSRADLINKMKTLDAVEITTPAQFNDIHSKQWLHTAGYAMDINGNLVGQTYFGDKDGKWYYATTKTFQGDYLPECKEESKKSEKATVTCSICGNPTDDPIWGEGNRAFCKDCYSDGDDFKHGKTKFVVGMMISLDGVKQYIRELKPRTFVGQSVDTGKEFSLPISSLNRASILYDPRNESKKSESLTLKQKELKNMARYGEATDITTISDAEAKELKKKGIETVGISRGAYGMNGALLRDNEGNKYVITARSSNLFYFV